MKIRPFLFALIPLVFVGCDGTDSATTPSSTTASELPQRRVVRQAQLDRSGKLTHYWLYRYDAQDNRNRVDYYDSQSVLHSYTIDSLDDRSRCVKSTVFDSIGRVQRSTTYRYGNAMWPTSSEHLGASGNPTSRGSYVFDDSGNMLSYEDVGIKGTVNLKKTFYNGPKGRDSTSEIDRNGVRRLLSRFDHSVPNQITISFFDSSRTITGTRVLSYEGKPCVQSEFYFGIW